MKLVAFDTSTDACSVAVKIDDEVRIDHRIVQREHSALLLSMVQGLLDQFSVKPCDLDGVVFGQGPGSFTGVRIAAAAAQGLAIAANCGVQGISSLQAMASACVRQSCGSVDGSEWVVAALDARMDQIYANSYLAKSGFQALSDEVVVNADEFTLPAPGSAGVVKKLLICGSGAERYESALVERINQLGKFELGMIRGVVPHAQDLLSLIDARHSASWLLPEKAQPVYLRNKVALTEAERSSS